MPGLATICVLFSHKANGEKAHKYRLCRHLPSYIGLGLKIVSRLVIIINAKLNMKESVQKMNGRKKYVGESYSFYRKNRPIGKGGNGVVYEVELLSDNGLGFVNGK